MRKTSLLITSILLTACSNYSDYSSANNDLSVPAGWEISHDNYTNVDDNLICLPWWQQFDDPTLNALIDKGLLYNNDILTAAANIEAAQGELKRVHLDWIPEITANGGYSSFPDLGFPGVLLTIVPTYTLNIFKQINQQKRAKYELKATAAMYAGVRLAVIGQIVGAYFNYLAQREEFELLSSLEADLTRLMTIAEKMYHNDLYSKVEVEQAKTELHLIQARKNKVKQNIIVSQNSIQYLLNKNPGKLPDTPKFSQLSGQHMIIGALPLTVIENRPDMQQARQELAAANEGMRIAGTNLLPTVQLSMARGDIATVPNGYTLGSAIHFNQALLEVPILRASVFGQIAKAKGLNKAAYYQYSATLRRVLQDVSNDLSAHELYSKRLGDVVKAQQNLQQVFKLNNELYQRGIISYQDLMLEHVLLTRLAIKLNQHKLEQFITIVNLYQDLAVGYNYIPSNSPKNTACSVSKSIDVFPVEQIYNENS